MSEIKSIKDLNPINNIPNMDPSDTPKEEVENEEEVVAEVEGTTEKEESEATTEVTDGIYHDDLPYVSPDEDTSFGTSFDFGASINRRRELVTTKIDNIKEELVEEEISEDDGNEPSEGFSFDDEDEDDTTPLEVVPKVEKEEVKEEPKHKEFASDDLPSQGDLFLDDDDFKDIDEDFRELNEDENDDNFDAEYNNLKSSITEKLKATEKNYDITGFTIAKKAISANAAINYDETATKLFGWPLMSAGKLVSMSSFSGTEIEMLNGGNSRNRFNNQKDIYREIYNHISDPDKPKFEAWLKVTSFMDVPHLYMAAYNASFNDSNYIPYTCTNTNPKCEHIFLSDNIDIREQMVKFKDDKAKLKFNEIMDNGSVSSNKLYETRIVPISDRYAIGFREPSIYNTIFENAVLTPEFITKYQKVISLMVYIDKIYLINKGELIPIALKDYANDMVKTIKYKIHTYARIINTLKSDSYQKILVMIQSINELGDEVTYQLPEVTCPKCSYVIPAEEKDSIELLFSRHQLALIANS